MHVEKVGVVGGGTMGAGIAEVCARAGLDVVLVEGDPAGVDRCLSRTESSMQRAVLAGRFS